MIAYTLLCGYSPFRSDDKNELVKETTRGKIVFHERYWKNVSETGKSGLPPLPSGVDERVSHLISHMKVDGTGGLGSGGSDGVTGSVRIANPP